MSKRPAIPADLKRRILVEAGHRCAIHTCRHSTTEVHHIVPWESCREHSYDNLIALCPNCHTRADAGEIDRKSLRLYKQQLIAALGIPSETNVASTYALVKKGKGRWITSLMEDLQTDPVPYELSVEFPQFLPNEGDLEELNLILYADALRSLHLYRRHLIPPSVEIPEWAGHDTLSQSFEVSLFTEDLISIKFSLYEFGSGAAHGNQGSTTANYQRQPLIPLELTDVVDDGNPATIGAIAEFVQNDLVRQKGLIDLDDWITRGVAAEWENFQVFNILPGGLLFTFDPYLVGPYADGPYQVYLDAEFLRPYLLPHTKVPSLWE